MKERLIIKNFGPIKSVDLELGKMNILIGESASGKSTVAKVLAICRYFSYVIDSENGILINQYKFDGIDDWGIGEYIKEDTVWEYENNDYSFNVKIEKLTFFESEQVDKLIFHKEIRPKSSKFIELIEKVKQLEPYLDYNRNPNGLYMNLPLKFLTNEVKPIMNNPFYFPTERGLQSIFSLGKSSIQNINDSLYNQFSKLDMFARYFKGETSITPLNLTYYNANGKGFIKNNNQKAFTSLVNGASGYQSTIPIILAIKYYSEKEKKKKTFIIEEPELNLYPKAQKKLVEFLTESINDFDHQMLLTTHSPYILTALENLMYAHKMGNIANRKYKEQVKKIVEERFWINVEDVNVYFLGKDGSVDLMDRDEVLINKDFIDSVSESINEVFDALLNLEIDIEKGVE